MNNKEKYRDLCKSEDSIAIFQKDWWLDATCGANGWDVVLSERNGEIIGALPYTVSRFKKVFRVITMPILTPFLGPWIKNTNSMKYEKRLSLEKDVYTSLINGLPNADLYSQCFTYNTKNWLPFFGVDFVRFRDVPMC